jgi:hypothetical protein
MTVKLHPFGYRCSKCLIMPPAAIEYCRGCDDWLEHDHLHVHCGCGFAWLMRCADDPPPAGPPPDPAPLPPPAPTSSPTTEPAKAGAA